MHRYGHFVYASSLSFCIVSSRSRAQPGCSTSSPLRLRFRFASPMIRHRTLIGCTRLGCLSNCSNCTRTRPLCHRLLSVSSRRRQRVIGHHRSLVDRGFESSATDEIVHSMKDDEERERQEGLMDRSDGVVEAEEARMNRSHHGRGLHRPSSADSWPLSGGERFALGSALESSENASHIASPMAFVMRCVKHFNGTSICEDRRTVP